MRRGVVALACRNEQVRVAGDWIFAKLLDFLASGSASEGKGPVSYAANVTDCDSDVAPKQISSDPKGVFENRALHRQGPGPFRTSRQARQRPLKPRHALSHANLENMARENSPT